MTRRVIRVEGFEEVLEVKERQAQADKESKLSQSIEEWIHSKELKYTDDGSLIGGASSLPWPSSHPLIRTAIKDHLLEGAQGYDNGLVRLFYYAGQKKQALNLQDRISYDLKKAGWLAIELKSVPSLPKML